MESTQARTACITEVGPHTYGVLTQIHTPLTFVHSHMGATRTVTTVTTLTSQTRVSSHYRTQSTSQPTPHHHRTQLNLQHLTPGDYMSSSSRAEAHAAPRDPRTVSPQSRTAVARSPDHRINHRTHPSKQPHRFLIGR